MCHMRWGHDKRCGLFIFCPTRSPRGAHPCPCACCCVCTATEVHIAQTCAPNVRPLLPDIALNARTLGINSAAGRCQSSVLLLPAERVPQLYIHLAFARGSCNEARVLSLPPLAVLRRMLPRCCFAGGVVDMRLQTFVPMSFPQASVAALQPQSCGVRCAVVQALHRFSPQCAFPPQHRCHAPCGLGVGCACRMARPPPPLRRYLVLPCGDVCRGPQRLMEALRGRLPQDATSAREWHCNAGPPVHWKHPRALVYRSQQCRAAQDDRVRPGGKGRGRAAAVHRCGWQQQSVRSRAARRLGDLLGGGGRHPESAGPNALTNANRGASGSIRGPASNHVDNDTPGCGYGLHGCLHASQAAAERPDPSGPGLPNVRLGREGARLPAACWRGLHRLRPGGSLGGAL